MSKNNSVIIIIYIIRIQCEFNMTGRPYTLYILKY